MSEAKSTRLIWITGNAQHLVADIARVSNPTKQGSDDIEDLLRYMIRHKHWSPFEMVSACFEINTTRDITRQILRHRSFSFQEFSQRYASPQDLGYETKALRYQGVTNRQSSIDPPKDGSKQTESDEAFFSLAQSKHYERSLNLYQEAISRGIAKEQARAFLPEGMTMSRLYMSGTLRSWIHYTGLRMSQDTQHEHRLIAMEINQELAKYCPIIWKALTTIDTRQP